MADTTIKITADAAQAQAALRTLGDSVGGVGRKLMDMSAMAGTLGGALSLTAFATFLKNTVDGIDALNDLADATGASIENLSALEDIAARTGTSMDTVGTALVKFNKTLEEARPGSGAEMALRQIGLSANELKNLDPAEALRQTAVALSGFADDGDKARLVQELFGKSVKEVAPLLKDLAEGGQLVAKVTKEQAEQAERFNHQLSALKKDATDAGRAIVSEMLPAMQRLIDEFKLGMKYSDGFFDAVFTYGFKYSPGNSPAENIKAINTELVKLTRTRDDFQNQGLSTQGLDADIARMERQRQYFKDLQLKSVDYGADNQSAAEDRRLGVKPAAAPRSVGKLADPAALKARADLEAKILADNSAAWQKYYDDIEAARTKDSEASTKKWLDEQARQTASEEAWQQKTAERLAQIQTDNMSVEELERGHLATIQTELEAARNAGFITEQAYNELLYQETLKHQARMGDAHAQGALARQKFTQMTAMQQTQTVLGEMVRMTQGVATQNKTLFEINKAAGIAQASIALYEGTSKTWNAYPYPWNIPMTALHVATGLAHIQGIASAQFGSSTSAPTVAGGGAIPVYNAGGTSAPAGALPAPNAGVAEQRQQVNITFQGSGRYTYDEVVNGIAPLLKEASGNGAVDLQVAFA